MAKKTNGHDKRGALHLYRSYMFRDKDPVIDRVRTLVKDEGVSYKDVHFISGVSVTTLHNWFDGETRKPQYATIAAVTTSLGYKQEFVKSKEINFEREVAKAQKEIEEAAKGKGK
jgi:transcriptional regulator with XRE-family HTH domain